MRVRLGALRRLIRETAMSPAFFAQGKALDDPFANPQLAQPAKQLEHAFEASLVKSLVRSAADRYDTKTRQFDDAAYDEIKASAASISIQVGERLRKLITQGWSLAHQNVRKDDKHDEDQIAA